MQAVKIDVQFGTLGAVFVAFLIEFTSGFAMCFPHEVVLALAAKTERFCGTGIVAVPSLSSAVIY
jgi:hypothetical protein